METKKFENLCKKLSNHFENKTIGEAAATYPKLFFKLTDNERFIRICDYMGFLSNEIAFLGSPEFDDISSTSIYYYVKNIFTELVRKEYEKMFSKKQLEKLEELQGTIEFVHFEKNKYNANKFWKGFQQICKKNIDKKSLEALKFPKNDQKAYFGILSNKIRHPLARLLVSLTVLEEELFGTNILMKEFTKRFEKMIKLSCLS